MNYDSSTVKKNQFYPFMLWDQVRNTGYYRPVRAGPNFDNFCSKSVGYSAVCFLDAPAGESFITVCPSSFNKPTTSSLGEPGTHGNAPGSTAEFFLYGDTVSRVINHELLHLAYPTSMPTFPFYPFVTSVLTPSFEMQSSRTNLERYLLITIGRTSGGYLQTFQRGQLLIRKSRMV